MGLRGRGCFCCQLLAVGNTLAPKNCWQRSCCPSEGERLAPHRTGEPRGGRPPHPCGVGTCPLPFPRAPPLTPGSRSAVQGRPSSGAEAEKTPRAGARRDVCGAERERTGETQPGLGSLRRDRDALN